MAETGTNSSSPCYQFEGNKIQQLADWLPCGPWSNNGPVLSCCRLEDYCMSDGICHSASSSTGASGYYQGSCTDAEYENSLCPHLCNDQVLPDVKYNTTLSEWQCCGENDAGDVSCDAPTTNEFFNAPVPSQLATTASAGQTTLPASSTQESQSTTRTNSAATGATSASASSTPTSTPARLSTGAIAGIAIGGALIALVALGALIWYLLRKRRRGSEGLAPQELPNDDTNNMALQENKTTRFGDQRWPAALEADSAEVHEMDQPEHKMYYDYSKQQWVYKEDGRSGVVSRPAEMPADPISASGMSRHDMETFAAPMRIELPGHER